ncbi:MAG: Fic family protein [Saprospiraceae bacterium]|nr:Fic family protein [Saprospiraceae bacterium]
MFQTVDVLKEELLSLEPMKDSDKRRLDEKFRLEFNYNSNHMEGNTLTYQDTKVLLLKDILPQGKLYQMRELEEMKAHDLAYALIREWAADPDREITERDIRELNKIILVKDFYKDAITPEGQPTRKIIKAGEYKSDPNSVLLANGEIFPYADPLDVRVKMQELMDWYRNEKDSIHPVILAAVFHHKFVLIHPFDDGNGRISRLLMNYILLKNGFPPVIIKSTEKQKYLNALRLADAGNLEAFIKYISEQLSWSLEISIKAAKGESVEEMGDVSKKLDILLKQESLKGEVAGKYSIQKVDALMNNSFKNLFQGLETVLEKFDV